MHKCPKCGADFEGNFCPECGCEWQEVKKCPQCGAELDGSSKFCNVCGYSFFKTEQKPEGKPKVNLKFIGAWVKAHLKIIIPVAVAVILVIVLACSIPACIKAKPNGTYYKVSYNGELDKETYFVLKSGKWSDEDGESGTYKLNGDKIVFYYTLFGETEEIVDGTLKNYVLTVDGDKYVSKKHKHKYGEWETVIEPSCLNDGDEARTCACGVKEERKILKNDSLHIIEIFDSVEKDYHSGECTVCGNDANQAHSGENCACGFPYVFTLNDDGSSYEFSHYYSSAAQYSIPSTYNNLPVTSIDYLAFQDCYNLTSVTIPDSVTSIKGNSFYHCSGLESLTVSGGNSVYHSKGNCIIETQSKTLILGCKNSIIPADGSVTAIGYTAFADCTGLTSVTIPDSVTNIDGGAFQNCSGLKSVTIPDSVTTIGSYAFHECDSLTNVTIPDSVTSIGQWAFNGTALYNNESNWQNGVFYIGKHLIEADNDISGSYSIKQGTLTIDSMAFNDCYGLTAVTIPDSVKYIGDYAFSNCYGLTSVTIPDCVTEIGEYAFSDCSGLTSITIGNGVKSIGDSAFWNCSGLTSLTIPDSVTNIGYSAFGECNALTSVTIPALAIEYIPKTNLKTVVITSGNAIDGRAFFECETLTSVTIPDSVTEIGYYAFYGCVGLTSVTIPDGVTTIGNGAFFGCVGLTSVVIPDSVTTIYEYAFYDCSGLTSVSIPDGVTTIGGYTFYGCSNLTSVTIGNGATKISSHAFEYCSKLTSITIGNSVTEISSHAFEDCSGLEKVYYNGTAEEWAKISIYSYNSNIKWVTRYYYSEEPPTEEGNYWHYVDGVVTEW